MLWHSALLQYLVTIRTIQVLQGGEESCSYLLRKAWWRYLEFCYLFLDQSGCMIRFCQSFNFYSQNLYFETHIRSMAAFLVSKSGVLPEQISNSCYWKTHNSLLHSTRRCSLAIPWPVHEQIGPCRFTSACSLFLCIYTCYWYDSHIYVLSSYTSLVSLTYVFLGLHMAPYLQFMQFSLPAWRYSHCQMMTSCLGSHAGISGQYRVMVNTGIWFVVKLPTTATAATMTTTSWISCWG